MLPNPPPAANAAGTDRSRLELRPPDAVRKACLLILASLFLGLVTLIPGVQPVSPDAADTPLLVTIFVAALSIGLTVWLAVKVYDGRNWARWAMLAFLALGWWLDGSELTEDFIQSPLAGAIEAICIVMEAVACGYLFFGRGARWYAELSAQRGKNVRR